MSFSWRKAGVWCFCPEEHQVTASLKTARDTKPLIFDRKAKKDVKNRRFGAQGSTYTPYVQERWELVAYVNSTVIDDVAQPLARESSVSGALNDTYGLGRLSTVGGTEAVPVADTYLEDGFGSVSAVMAGDGRIAASYAYTPWGEAAADTGEFGGPALGGLGRPHGPRVRRKEPLQATAGRQEAGDQAVDGSQEHDPEAEEDLGNIEDRHDCQKGPERPEGQDPMGPSEKGDPEYREDGEAVGLQVGRLRRGRQRMAPGLLVL